jgi:hypothetical protein
MDSPVLQTVIGLVFIFATFAALVSIATEGISRFFGLRGEYLLRGIRSLVDGDGNFSLSVTKDLFRGKSGKPDGGPEPMVTQIMSHPFIASSGTQGEPVADAGNAKLSRVARKALPSYVSGRAFASAVLGILVPDVDGETSLTQVRASVNSLEGQDELKKRLLLLVNQADGSVAKFRTSLEHWYDDHMARVSGWYKRHVKWISLGLATAFVLVFNLNAVDIGRTLYSDESVRTALVTQAEHVADCDQQDRACLVKLRKELRDAQNAGIPLGWGTDPICTLDGADCTWPEKVGIFPVDAGGSDKFWGIVVLLLGWLLMALAAVPGSRFWMDSLSKLGSLRSTGPKPASSTDG